MRLSNEECKVEIDMTGVAEPSVEFDFGEHNIGSFIQISAPSSLIDRVSCRVCLMCYCVAYCISIFYL